MIRLLWSLTRQVRYNTLVTFVIGTIIGGTLEVYIGGWIDEFGVWAPLLATIVVLLAGITFVAVSRLAKRLLVRQTIDLGNPPPGDRYRGIVLVLGGGSNATGPIALQHHQSTLERIWLIHTDFTKEIGNELKRSWEMPNRHVYLIDVEHHYDPRQTAMAVTRAVDHGHQYQIFPQEIICGSLGIQVVDIE